MHKEVPWTTYTDYLEDYVLISRKNYNVIFFISRQVMGGPGGVGTGGSFGENPYAGANTGTMMALGTLANPQPNMLAMGSNTLMPYHKRATANYPSQSATLLRSSNHSYNGAFQVSCSLSV